MPRSLWNGTISVGVIAVPVKLYTAVESRTVRFREVQPEAKVLMITGSRGWGNVPEIVRRLKEYDPKEWHVIHGGARGVDRYPLS